MMFYSISALIVQELIPNATVPTHVISVNLFYVVKTTRQQW